jgi:hypothetical protein
MSAHPGAMGTQWYGHGLNTADSLPDPWGQSQA